MDYILEEVHTGKKLVITKDQKDILEELGEVEYSPVDTKIICINKAKYYVNVIR